MMTPYGSEQSIVKRKFKEYFRLLLKGTTILVMNARIYYKIAEKRALLWEP